MPTNRSRPTRRAREQAERVDDAALRDHGGGPFTKKQQRAVEGIRTVRRQLTGSGPLLPVQGE